MTVTVVIPTLNEERTLPHTLAQTATLGFNQIIVVDGGSDDQTQDVVRTFMLSPQSSVLSPIALLSAPPGRAGQMNRGATESRTDILLFLHADTVLPADAKQVIERTLRDPACVGGRFDVQFERTSLLGFLISALMNLRSRWSGIATGDQAIFVRRTVFEQLGGYAEIPLMEDVEFCRRLKRSGRVAGLRAKVTTSYRRWHECGPIRTIVLMWILRGLYRLGVSPHRLQRLYTTVR